jgi:hypothetical protein
MSGTYFETFLVGGLGLLVAAVLAITWLLWSQGETRREAIKLSLEGIGHEFRFNMFQTVRELADICHGRIRLARDIPETVHPQLDAVLGEVMATDKRPLAAVQATYQSIEATKRRLRYALDHEQAIDEPLEAAKQAAINGISTLYLWEKHEGRAPDRARSTRSWWVRDWMKQHGFHQDLLPGLYLRDAVVEELREKGMVLTPQPLALSAHEYYSRQYDRQADPRGVFGKRKIEKPADEEAAAPEDVSEVPAEEPPAETASNVAPIRSDVPAATEPKAVPELTGEAAPVESNPDIPDGFEKNPQRGSGS